MSSFPHNKEGAESSAPSSFFTLQSVQNLHQSAAAEGDGVAGFDVLGFVAGDAVDVGVVGGADHGDLLGLLLAQTVDVERGGLVLAGDIHPDGRQGLVFAHAVAHLDPQGLQLGGLGGVLGGELHNVLVDTDFHNGYLTILNRFIPCG